MTKIMVKDDTYETFSLTTIGWQYLDDAIEYLKGIQERHPGEKLYLDVIYENYSNNPSMSVLSEREETDEEYNARMERKAANDKAEEEHLRAEFERLKKRFGE